MKTWSFLPIVSIILVCASVAQAQRGAGAPRETVVVRNRAESRGVSEFQGTIQKFDRDRLELETPERGLRVIPSGNVVEIRFPKSPDFRLAEQCFAQGNYAEALRIYTMERQLTQKPWLQTLLTARMIRCQTALGQGVAAMEEFVRLAALEPNMTDETLACIPLAWRGNPGQTALEAAAARLLKTSGTPPVVLMCASHLLSGPQREDALRRLKRLSETCKDTRIAQLAQFQIHRTEVPGVTPESVSEWKSRLDTLPPELSSGPNFVLGQAYARLRLWDDAALTFLKSATVFPQDAPLSQSALQSAAQALQSGGHPEEAKKLAD